MNTIYRDTGATKMLERVCIVFLSAVLMIGCLVLWSVIRSNMEINRLQARIVVLEDQQSYLAKEGRGLVMKVGELEAKMQDAENEVVDGDGGMGR